MSKNKKIFLLCSARANNMPDVTYLYRYKHKIKTGHFYVCTGQHIALFVKHDCDLDLKWKINKRKLS